MKHATKIRNRVAHGSTKCIEDFKKTAKHHLSIAKNGKLKQGYRVADLLRDKAVRHFGNEAKNKDWTFFEAYLDMYDTLAATIVPPLPVAGHP